MAPNQSNMANPPKRFWQNFTHSGVVGGGVKALAGIENPKKDYENAIKYIYIHPKLDLMNLVIRPLLFTKLSPFIKLRLNKE